MHFSGKSSCSKPIVPMSEVYANVYNMSLYNEGKFSICILQCFNRFAALSSYAIVDQDNQDRWFMK